MTNFLMSLVLLFSLGLSSVAAQTIPTKTISFYNNSENHTIYPVIQAPIMKGGLTTPVHDLWMQAIFNVRNVETQIFNTTLLYKIYVNRTTGIAPHHSVTLTIPFYTQLLPANEHDLGKVDDQFVDWWNAMRIFVFDGPTAINAAYDYSVGRNGQVIPPIAVNPVAGAAVPACAPDRAECEPPIMKAYVNGYPTSIPYQLVEYTFAAAQGPPLDPVLSINNRIVNFNISAVDQVYLPVAIGAHGNSTEENAYLGSTEALVGEAGGFRDALSAFAANGALWPVYVPAYYTAESPIVPLPDPPPGRKPYPLPEIPSTNTVYAESFRNPPPAPPVLSSDTLNGIGQLGTVGQATLDLWKRCTDSAANKTATCERIREVKEFFVADYHQCFPKDPLPGTEAFLRDVYGWVQFPGCSTPLSSAPGYPTAIAIYCDLEYNFFDASVLPDYIFNPYVRLIHQTLASNAYAFSIDDAVSFKSLPGDGIIVTIAGPVGLENKTQTPLPTASTYKRYCRL